MPLGMQNASLEVVERGLRFRRSKGFIHGFLLANFARWFLQLSLRMKQFRQCCVPNFGQHFHQICRPQNTATRQVADSSHHALVQSRLVIWTGIFSGLAIRLFFKHDMGYPRTPLPKYMIYSVHHKIINVNFSRSWAIWIKNGRCFSLQISAKKKHLLLFIHIAPGVRPITSLAVLFMNLCECVTLPTFCELFESEKICFSN
jgi:hypothetical protein